MANDVPAQLAQRQVPVVRPGSVRDPDPEYWAPRAPTTKLVRDFLSR
jgi:hypothetical protein